MSRNITTGIDIGTHSIKVLISEHRKDDDKGKGVTKVIGIGSAETKGLQRGYVINGEEVTKSILDALKEAEKKAKIKVKRVYVSVGGVGLSGITSKGEVTVSSPDSEVSENDVSKSIETSEQEIPSSTLLNRKIIHSIPTEFKLDGSPVLGKPEGMKGVKLECKTLFVTYLESHLNHLIEAVEEANVEVADVMASPIAASLATLSKTQKMAGCVLANIGAETTSIVVYENNIPISLEVFPVGSNDITNDIALGLKVPLEEAEHIKIGVVSGSNYSKKKLDDIISARLSDMFEFIESHLKKIGRNGLLPAGIILTGGGVGIGNIENSAKSSLNLPAKVTEVNQNLIEKGDLIGPSWTVAYGLCILGFNSDEEKVINVRGVAKRTKSKAISFFKQFLP